MCIIKSINCNNSFKVIKHNSQFLLLISINESYGVIRFIQIMLFNIPFLSVIDNSKQSNIIKVTIFNKTYQ